MILGMGSQRKYAEFNKSRHRNTPNRKLVELAEKGETKAQVELKKRIKQGKHINLSKPGPIFSKKIKFVHIFPEPRQDECEVYAYEIKVNDLIVLDLTKNYTVIKIIDIGDNKYKFHVRNEKDGFIHERTIFAKQPIKMAMTEEQKRARAAKAKQEAEDRAREEKASLLDW